MHLKISFLILLFAVSTNLYAQTNEEISKADYLSVKTGFIVDRYNSLGLTTYFEYQKDLKQNWQYGIAYEHSTHLGFLATDQLYQLSSNLSLLSLNGYYKLNAIKDKLFWEFGLGIGGAHVNWDNNNAFGVTVNTSLTLNMKLSKRIYVEASPLIILLPADRVYFSTMDVDHFSSFYAFSFFPVGIKVKM
ncbi:MAG TPA: hypothetical protein VKA27_09715 [Sunxiuqinia sp.]|nr:hypothetical protein [Sunxiuqinia sp.]